MSDENNINRRLYRNMAYQNSVNPYDLSIGLSPPSLQPNIHINVQHQMIPPPQAPQTMNGFIIPNYHNVPYHALNYAHHHVLISSNTTNFPYPQYHHHHHFHGIASNNNNNINNHVLISQAIANLQNQHMINTQSMHVPFVVPPPPRHGYNLNAEPSDDVSNENNVTSPENSPGEDQVHGEESQTEQEQEQEQEQEPEPQVLAATPAGSTGSRMTTFECNICLDSPREAVVTFCGHLFCWKCLYLSHCVRQLCPVCKARMVRLQDVVVPVYGGGTRQDGAASPAGSRIPPRPRGRLPPGTTNINNHALDLFPM